MDEVTGAFVQTLLNEAVRVLVPVVMALVAGWIAYGIAWVRGKVGETRWAAIAEAVRFAVLAAEQTGLKDCAFEAGSKKKALALDIAQGFLDARGIKVDLAQLDALIEAEVMRSINLEGVVASKGSR